MRSVTPKPENVASLIFFVRGEKVLLDADLAVLYGVEARALNQAVARNRKRFPADFMFRLSAEEYERIRSRFVTASQASHPNSSQTVMSSRKHRGRAYRPYAFTEQGVAMLSSVLRSPRAIEVNIAIMRTHALILPLKAGLTALVGENDTGKTAVINHRFTAADIRRLHRLWLGPVYAWAGEYRTVNIGKDGFQFASARLIPELMEAFARNILSRYTPCRPASTANIAQALAVVHGELVLIDCRHALIAGIQQMGSFLEACRKLKLKVRLQ